MIHVQGSVAGGISLTADVMKRFEHCGDGLEVFEALEFVFFDLMSFVAHA